jgi:hypothetical protein
MQGTTIGGNYCIISYSIAILLTLCKLITKKQKKRHRKFYSNLEHINFSKAFFVILSMVLCSSNCRYRSTVDKTAQQYNDYAELL